MYDVDRTMNVPLQIGFTMAIVPIFFDDLTGKQLKPEEVVTVRIQLSSGTYELDLSASSEVQLQVKLGDVLVNARKVDEKPAARKAIRKSPSPKRIGLKVDALSRIGKVQAGEETLLRSACSEANAYNARKALKAAGVELIFKNRRRATHSSSYLVDVYMIVR